MMWSFFIVLYTVTGISLDWFVMWFPKENWSRLSRLMYTLNIALTFQETHNGGSSRRILGRRLQLCFVTFMTPQHIHDYLALFITLRESDFTAQPPTTSYCPLLRHRIINRRLAGLEQLDVLFLCCSALNTNGMTWPPQAMGGMLPGTFQFSDVIPAQQSRTQWLQSGGSLPGGLEMVGLVLGTRASLTSQKRLNFSINSR